MKKLFVFATIWLISICGYAAELRIWGPSEPPGNFTDEHGEFVGLSVDVVREIQQRVGNTDSIEMVPWKRIYKTALKEPNIVFFSVARTPEREEKFHWITLMMRKPWAFYAKKSSDLRIMSLDDAKRVDAIGVHAGDIRDNWLQQQGFTNIDRVASHELNVAKLERKRVSLIFYSLQGMTHTCRELGYDFDKFEIVLVPHSSLSYLAMSKNGTSEETVKQWKDAARQMIEDGRFDQFAEKWAVYTREKNGMDCEVKDGALNFWKEKQ
jgi:polar amino acid transport system substrate-binding protein